MRRKQCPARYEAVRRHCVAGRRKSWQGQDRIGPECTLIAIPMGDLCERDVLVSDLTYSKHSSRTRSRSVSDCRSRATACGSWILASFTNGMTPGGMCDSRLSSNRAFASIIAAREPLQLIGRNRSINAASTLLGWRAGEKRFRLFRPHLGTTRFRGCANVMIEAASGYRASLSSSHQAMSASQEIASAGLPLTVA